MRTVPALAVTLLAPFALVAPEANSVRADRVSTSISTEQPSVEDARQEPTPTVESHARINVSARPTVTVSGASDSQQALLDEALARFRDHGLELPDIDVRFSDDETDCGGNLGIFENSYTPWRLSICSEVTLIPTHELAHAWEAANLDDDARERYIDARGLTNWNDREARWADRGVEDSARMMQQNLMAANPQLTLSVWAERLDAYELLVGRPSPLRNEFNEVNAESDRLDEVELVKSLTPEEETLVGWATRRFAQAGLELPEPPVRLYRQEANRERVVTFCTPDVDTFAAQLWRPRTLLHEFGHAWNDHDDPWTDRGIERFAEPFVFALLDQPRRQLKMDLECINLRSTFRVTTEAEPLGPGLQPCVDVDGQPDRVSAERDASLIIQDAIDAALADASTLDGWRQPDIGSGKPVLERPEHDGFDVTGQDLVRSSDRSVSSHSSIVTARSCSNSAAASSGLMKSPD